MKQWTCPFEGTERLLNFVETLVFASRAIDITGRVEKNVFYFLDEDW